MSNELYAEVSALALKLHTEYEMHRSDVMRRLATVDWGSYYVTQAGDVIAVQHVLKEKTQ